jgi:DNA-binding transcriptional MerR regulator
MGGQFTRRQVSEELHIGAESLRYYEKIKLIPKPRRSGSGYRLYSDEDLSRLRFIKRAKALGFSLGEVKSIFGMLGSKRILDEAVLAGRIDEKTREIDRRIADLRSLKRELERAKEETSRPGCRFFDFLSSNP